MLSLSLFIASFCLASVPIRYISKTNCFTGPTEHFYITIYSLIPPTSYPSSKSGNLPTAKSPIKDNLYAIFTASIFLLLGFYKLKLRWIYHIATGSLGLFVSTMLFLNFHSTICFVQGILLLGFISLLSIITGIEILRNKDNEVASCNQPSAPLQADT